MKEKEVSHKQKNEEKKEEVKEKSEREREGKISLELKNNSEQQKEEKKPIKLDIDEEEMMKQLIGVSNFDTSKVIQPIIKNKSHVDSDLSAVFKGANEKRRYRQYMNRRGGFNRPLDKMD